MLTFEVLLPFEGSEPFKLTKPKRTFEVDEDLEGWKLFRRTFEVYENLEGFDQLSAHPASCHQHRYLQPPVLQAAWLFPSTL